MPRAPFLPARQAGARNRMSHRAAMAISRDFELHRGAVLNRASLEPVAQAGRIYGD